MHLVIGVEKGFMGDAVRAGGRRDSNLSDGERRREKVKKNKVSVGNHTSAKAKE